MSISFWDIIEHAIPAAHTRGYARGVREERSRPLQLAIKQYTPKSNPNPRPGDVTLIVAHAIASAKETFEPLYDDLLQCGLRIRSVWAADAVNHGVSYLLNEDIIGDEPHWHDHSRDLVHMINYFQELMPSPLIGMGLSLGNVSIIMMSVSHPRLFSGIVLLEPALGPGFGQVRTPPFRYFPGVLPAKRKDYWPSREIAEKHYRSSPFYRTYDARVLERVLKYELRDIPPRTSQSSASSQDSSMAVTLTTPKTMEAYTWLRADPPLFGFPEGPDYATRQEDSFVAPGFYRGESAQVYDSIPHIYPSTLYVWGEKSGVATKVDYQKKFLSVHGTGRGGSGGVATGRAKEVWIKKAGHMINNDQPKDTAIAVASWLNAEKTRWKEEEERKKNEPVINTQEIYTEWMARVAKL